MTFQQYPFKGGVPTGTTAQRPGSPAIGDVYYNGSAGVLEIYNGTDWVPCSAPSGTPVVSATDVGTSRAYTSGSISFIFTPQTTGGAPLGYTAVATTASTATVYQSTTTSTTTTLAVGLPGTYTFYGNSYNGFGTSPNAVPSTVEVTTVPQAPTIGTASTGTQTTNITVTWTLGATGGKNLTSITITPYLNGTTAQTSQTAATTSSTSHAFTGLAQGSAYTFKVKATNANGDSLESSATNSVTVPTAIATRAVVVAGGGAGGFDRGSGGAGGGIVDMSSNDFTVFNGQAIQLTIGAGGTATTANATQPSGGDSTFGSLVAKGGGGGATNQSGGTGGCGGGGGWTGGNVGGASNQSSQSGNSGTYGFGFAGGDGGSGFIGGGGGAGAAGASSSPTTSSNRPNGGNGRTVSLNNTTYAGGGGGAQASDGGPFYIQGFGGTGGGGAGSNGTTKTGTAGSTNTGGGGGGGGNIPATVGANGGSGIIIFRIPDTRTASFSGGVTYTGGSSSGGFRTYTVTAAGSSDTVTLN